MYSVTSSKASISSKICTYLTVHPIYYHLYLSYLFLRKQIQDNIAEEERSKFGSTIEGLISTGQILPSWVTISLLHQELVRIAELKNPETQGKNVVLVDGFPRSVENFTQYETQIQTCSSVIVLDCTPDEMIRRVVSRGLTSGRADDQSTKTIIGRIEIFNTETETVLSNFTPFRHDMNTNIDHVAKTAENRVAIRVDGDPAPDVVSKLFRHAVETLVRRHSME